MPTIAPSAAFALAAVAVVLGLALILAPRGLMNLQRRMIVWQLRMMRRPRFIRVVRFYGWLLFVLGVLVALLQWLILTAEA
ncbi:hypothetical protein [Sphingomicrobium clamense]|uniref:Transmembrane protein n=1 Tax=Sphingomicrobium clamense TaxID=2851013 RepID=A0ABS6V3U8_9SPHN|nr:hypothetical protein [Sphingomicrobium sp. B8]MBW0144235.1 hypothetical protein [Sphingomicrobium sp. B8]